MHCTRCMHRSHTQRHLQHQDGRRRSIFVWSGRIYDLRHTRPVSCSNSQWWHEGPRHQRWAHERRLHSGINRHRPQSSNGSSRRQAGDGAGVRVWIPPGVPRLPGLPRRHQSGDESNRLCRRTEVDNPLHQKLTYESAF